MRGRRGAIEHSLGKGLVVGPEEVEKRIRVGVDIELHLPLFHNLRHVSASVRRAGRDERTSNPASEIRSSISNLLLSAWFLMMATVRGDLDTGLFRRGVVGTSPGERAGEAGADIVG